MSIPWCPNRTRPDVAAQLVKRIMTGSGPQGPQQPEYAPGAHVLGAMIDRCDTCSIPQGKAKLGGAGAETDAWGRRTAGRGWSTSPRVSQGS